MMSAGEELSIMSPSRTGAVDIMCTWWQEEKKRRISGCETGGAMREGEGQRNLSIRLPEVR
jgi:hypothetical protein